MKQGWGLSMVGVTTIIHRQFDLVPPGTQGPGEGEAQKLGFVPLED